MPSLKNESGAIPQWFRDEVVALFALYPSAILSAPTILAWWRHLHGVAEDKILQRVLVQAFKRAPEQSTSFCPSAEIVRQVAEPIAKTLSCPVANLELRALPEPELTLPPDNPFHDMLERFKRGEIPRRQAADAARQIVSTLAAGMADESEATE